MKLRLIAALAVTAALTGCSSYQQPPPVFHEVLLQPYMLETSDQVRVIVYGQTDLSNTYSVDQAGFISFPLVGQVKARGLTQEQLAKSIEGKLRSGFIRNPNVSVEVADYRPIFVMGEVTGAGQYPFISGMTAQNAIATAGGFSPRAYQKTVDITRQINGEIFSGRVLITDPLRPGDTIYVRERLF
ncbi:polysaccharide export protein [Rhodobacteraceae bacterium RKSG542]|uniref:polysaccharide biosynthesis/export family protein n=1 Tax=Pseudovibrio flavus TaxID=2529854 RepID=UPI0012BB8473|nr:polysaccharide biosynthesis/export family protein [Pseudovibrio flavus]MTI17352.1 polysaccharide export protein [Pseudovibrio flavus]